MALRASLLSGLIGIAVCASAYAAEPVSFTAERTNGVSRIVVTYPEAFADAHPDAEAEIVGGQVLVVRLTDAIEGNTGEITSRLGDLVALARMDPDGTALRLALRNGAVTPQVSASYNLVAIDLVPVGIPPLPDIISPREQAEMDAAAAAAAAPPPPPPPALDVAVSFGQAAEYTRIELIWPEVVDYELVQDGDIATVGFSAPASMDLLDLRTSDPRLLEDIEGVRGENSYSLRLTLEEGATARIWDEGERIVIDLLADGVTNPTDVLSALAALADAQTPDESAEEMPVEEPAVADPVLAGHEIEVPDIEQGGPVAFEEAAEEGLNFIPPERADPVPPSGVVQAQVVEADGVLTASFEWAAPVGAAVFRRGSAVWIVFDAEAGLNLEELAHGSRGHVIGFTTVQGQDFTAARIVVPESTQAEVYSEGPVWRIVLAERIQSPPRPISVERDARRGTFARILVTLEGLGQTLWVDDPAVGDSLAVITAHGRIQGAPARRDFVGMALLPSYHGAAMEVTADDMVMTTQDGVVVFARPEGLSLSPTSDSILASGRRTLDSPAFMDFERWQREGAYWPTYTRLYAQAARGNTSDRIALARYMLANGLAAETLGIIDVAIDRDPAMQSNAHALALVGVASLMMGRVEDARLAFNAPELRNDPGIALWQAMVAAENEEWEEARRRFAASRELLFDYTPEWQARFRIMHAETALELNDFAAATELLRQLDNSNPGPGISARADWLEARLAAVSGDTASALRQLEALTAREFPEIQALAQLELYKIRIENQLISPAEAVEGLEMLRLRWRGDTIELETMNLLGRLYIRERHFSEGLRIMQNARIEFPDTQAARRTGQEMSRIFNELFLDGAADRMDPIEAVALFYEHSYLTPIGRDGDRMIRRLADRLVAFDLLDPAAQLLAHQVNERLREPAARARVGTDLAVIYLMDHRPSEALTIIRSTRIAGLPAELVTERRILEARALSELGRHEHALELIERDTSEEARRLRADVAWAQRNWPDAGRRIEAALGNRWSSPQPLTIDEQADVLRAAIAYNLANDRSAIDRLTARYGEQMAATDQADAFDVLTSDTSASSDVRIGDLARQIAGVDTLDAFMGRFRDRFSEDSDPA